MKPFKHLKPGMSLIEVIAAIAILAIFGSSLFLMQQFLFERMSIAQLKLIANLRMQTELIDYQTKILKEFFAQDGPVEKSLEPYAKDFVQPAMVVKITTQSNFKDSLDQKEPWISKFKNVHVITAQADQDGKEYGKLYVLTYIPEVEKT